MYFYIFADIGAKLEDLASTHTAEILSQTDLVSRMNDSFSSDSKSQRNSINQVKQDLSSEIASQGKDISSKITTQIASINSELSSKISTQSDLLETIERDLSSRITSQIAIVNKDLNNVTLDLATRSNSNVSTTAMYCNVLL